MEVLRSSSVAAFLDHAGAFLAEREAEHNLIFGILSNLEADPTHFAGPPYLATIVHGDKVVGAAIRTPPWRIVLSEMDHPGAVHRLAQDLADVALPGVVGPSEAASHFSEAWAELTRARPRLNRHERSFRLRRVIPPRPAGGEMVIARPEHLQLLGDWITAFHEEASLGNPVQDYHEMADRWIRRLGRTAYLWVDGGRPVSLTGVGGPTPHGIRVGRSTRHPRIGAGATRATSWRSNAGTARRRADVRLPLHRLANPTANRSTSHRVRACERRRRVGVE